MPLQFSPHGGARPVQAAPDRANRNVKQLGDSGVIEIFDLAQN